MNQYTKLPLPEWLALNSTTDLETGCIIWNGARGTKSYGHIIRSVNGKKIKFSTHRLAWEVAFGPIPPGMFVCHKCDVKSCINKDHLFLGTVQDNQTDMAKKGRSHKSKNGNLFGAYRNRSVREGWSARINCYGKRYHLGTYATEQEAHEVAMEFKRMMYAEEDEEVIHEPLVLR